jgi:hypothetical protein
MIHIIAEPVAQNALVARSVQLANAFAPQGKPIAPVSVSIPVQISITAEPATKSVHQAKYATMVYV